MSTTCRLFIDNACYHIFTRGNQRQAVFKTEDDYKYYLNLLRKAKKKYEILLYSYCLMPNHVHLLLESTPHRNISWFMHWLNRGYAEYFNNKYGTVGHLWQGRYKSKVILKDEYLISCASYIEGNPVRSAIVNNIVSYPWSSYHERCLAADNVWLDEIKL